MNSLLLSLVMSTSTVIPLHPPELIPPAPASLLFAKVIGPAGMRVTFHPGTPIAKSLEAPATVGLRPGYVYRLELSSPQYPDIKLYPSLEVRGALQTTLAQAMKYPVAIVFLDDEIRRVARAHSMITKVHYLEDPAQAAAIASTPDQPLMVDVPADARPLEEARDLGRPMVVVRFGEREPTNDELQRYAVPNTILFPNDQKLAVPPAPPQVPWLHVPVYDPIAGAKRSFEECLPDGGDIGPRVGIGPDGKVGGLDASDSAIEYTTEAGKRRVGVSNRICVFVPRYSVLRQEVVPAARLMASGPGYAIGTKTSSDMAQSRRLEGATGIEHLSATHSRTSVSGMESRVRLNGYENTKGVSITGTLAGVKTIGIIKEPDEITAYPFCEPISLFKWSDPKEAQVGDVVTFYLRYRNHTQQSVDSLAISDSLTARLEYIAGSAKSDREATLTVQPNEVGSLVLRWELTGKLPPGQSGVVAFKARVR